jgi:hypothetical protein
VTTVVSGVLTGDEIVRHVTTLSQDARVEHLDRLLIAEVDTDVADRQNKLRSPLSQQNRNVVFSAT